MPRLLQYQNALDDFEYHASNTGSSESAGLEITTIRSGPWRPTGWIERKKGSKHQCYDTTGQMLLPWNLVGIFFFDIGTTVIMMMGLWDGSKSFTAMPGRALYVIYYDIS